MLLSFAERADNEGGPPHPSSQFPANRGPIDAPISSHLANLAFPFSSTIKTEHAKYRWRSWRSSKKKIDRLFFLIRAQQCHAVRVARLRGPSLPLLPGARGVSRLRSSWR